MLAQSPNGNHTSGYDGPICCVCDAEAQYGGAAYGGYYCGEHLPQTTEDERARFLELEAAAIARWNACVARRKAERDGLAVRVSLHQAA